MPALEDSFLGHINTATPKLFMDIEQINCVKKIPHHHHDTSGSRTFADRIALIISNAYKGYNLFPEEQLMSFIGMLIESVQTAQNNVPDYRIDKSPTSTMNKDNIVEWYKMDSQELLRYDIEDQPRYSYNQAYELAKRIGFPTEFAL